MRSAAVSLSTVFVTEFIMVKVKNGDPCEDSGFVQEKEWRDELERDRKR